MAPITITASRSARVSADRRAYDVKVNPDLRTLNAEEVVARLPGVITDLQGRLTVLGQTAISYQINGESVPAGLALQVPAVQIQRVEMVTNPGADTKGAARVIINLVLKAPRPKAYGVARGKVDTLDRRELSLTVGRPVDNLDLTASLTLTHEPLTRRSTSRQDFVAGPEAGLSIARAGESRTESDQRQGQLMAGYKRGDWTYVVVGWLLDYGYRSAREQTERQALGGALARDFALDEDTRQNSRSGTVSLTGQRKRGGQSKDSWSIAPQWSRVDSRSRQDLTGLDRPDFQGWERSDSQGLNAKLAVERGETVADLLKLGIEAATTRGHARAWTQGYGDPQTRFDYVNESAGAYVTRQFTRGGFQALPGLRVEAARLRTRSDGAARVENAAPVRALPSLHLVYAPDGKTKLRASVSRRGGAPVPERYAATRRRTGYDNLSQGNPSLKVEDQWVLEGSYERVERRHAVLATVYARHTRDAAQAYYDYLGDGQYLDRYINLDRVDRLGLNLNWKLNVGAKADLAVDLLGYQEDRHWRLDGVPRARRASSYDVKLNGTYRFSADSSALLVLQYSGREAGLDTESSGRLSSSVKYVRGLGPDVSLALEAVDVLSTRRRTVTRAAPLYDSVSISEQARKALRVTLSRSF